MSLKLNECEQVIFEKSPLAEVVCQLRFHQILTIATALPAAFQERVRDHFPVFGEERGIQFGVAGSQPIIATNEPAWQFKTSDEASVVSLSSSFIALKTAAYEDFDHFLELLLPVVEAFEAVYEPPFYVRVGLRYVNRWVLPQPDGGKRVEWEKYLNNVLAGMFCDTALEGAIAEAKHHVVLNGERGKIGWRYSRDVGQSEGKPAEQFTLDFDHFDAGEVACSEVKSLLKDFNDSTFRLFCWCLTEEGYKALAPRPKTTQRRGRP
jgi:uncharacterized protein (TIGR04255 family)